MSTKLNPGKFDCYSKLEPDEPYYLLMGRSRIGSLLVRMELMTRRWEISMGLRTDTPEENEQIAEGFRCLTEMEIWHRDLTQRKAHQALEFDDRGVPTTGRHAFVANASTSGANDGT